MSQGRVIRQYATKKYKQGAEAQCEFCAWRAPSVSILHVHHVLPIAHGGTNDLANLVLLCPNHHAVAHYMFPMSSQIQAQSRAELFTALRLYQRKPETARARHTAKQTRAWVESLRPRAEKP